MTEVLTYEALKSKCENLEKQISHNNAQSLEGALKMADTIKELTARVNALAVENVAMREALDSIRIYSSDTLSGPSDFVPDMAAWLREGVEHLHQVSTIETPATDAALAAFQAQGVEKFADDLHKTAMAMCSVKPDNTTPGAYAVLARSFAKKLREAK
ncbi:hypothetical protein [Serratia marcescens]|uniref:hypothetical protein n=1 Tax=Serratia marcescens TaxID=615 RepID=UPI00114F0CA4|nr:hypothetical protein [Serratia marcescens]QDI41667.1 hypothetical protein FG172_05460 [Serratia marcescens]QDI56098.1 hypothetical protein FG175_05460 [Serratia marcescens]